MVGGDNGLYQVPDKPPLGIKPYPYPIPDHLDQHAHFQRDMLIIFNQVYSKPGTKMG